MSSRPDYNNRGRSRRNRFRNGKGQRNEQPKKDFAEQQKLEECDVGITEYISNHPGFTGIIKARFSDFHVNEINTFNEIAKLTDISVPKEFACNNLVEGESCEYPKELISEETWSDISKLVETQEDRVINVIVTNKTKEERTSIHDAVKRGFGKALVANTKESDGETVIQIKKFTKESRSSSFLQWPKGLGEYVYFLVYKEDVDSIGAVFKISDCLKIKSSTITYAGVKDKRAKTTQWFCIRKCNPERILEKTKPLRNIHIGNFTFKNQPLKIGHLNGNRFRIVLRNVTAEHSIINDALKSLESKGFINYYGLQRFGNDREVPTYEIGVKLLQGNWKEACQLVLKPRSIDDPNSDITKAKLTYKNTSDSSLACKEFRKNNNKCVESKLLLGLAKNNDNDYVNALENIPRNLRLLYLHAFQSLIWNRVVSYRIKEFGLKPVVGDLVLLSENCLEEFVDSADGEQNTETEDNSETFHQDTKILTEDDLDNYTIYDIVLPLPGFDVKYPENKIKDEYKNILTSYGLTLEMPKQRVKTYNLSGAYRKIMGTVENLNWKTMRYNHPNDSLIRSDYEELIGKAEPKEDPNGQYNALIVDFCLKSSCYATMVLREILKMETSATAHAKLNNYHDHGEIKESKSEKVEFADTTSLLSDAAKYEEFKKQIFQETTEEAPVKRKLEEVTEETENLKKSKIEEETSEASIKMQPSLI